MKAFAAISKSIAGIYSCRRVLWDTSLNFFKARYSGSYLGIGWSFLIPLLMAASIQFVFVHVFKVPFVNYGFFVLSGIVPWMFFSGASMVASNVFIGNAVLARKSSRRDLVPLACVLSEFLTFILGLCILFPFFFFLHPGFVVALPALVVACGLLLIFCFGLSLVLAPATVFVRDLTHVLPVVFMLLFWITPVFYSADMIPARFSAVATFNPVTYFIALFREILFYGRLPDYGTFIIAAFLSVVSLCVGLSFFAAKESRLLKML